ncbi:hypothetical protein [uncultured Tateyamaria sp.]|uniref:hypothetical protein n=1 Tax=Tateyamaria sp. 1078 TaxID=3417464 RepID=UPI00262703C8|nr:hypothetical protein [uncultured Tateyamaria sp.]
MRLLLLFLFMLSWPQAGHAQQRCTDHTQGSTFLAPVQFDCDRDARAYMLEGFDLQFENGDHKPHMIVVAIATDNLNRFLERSRAGGRTYARRSNGMVVGFNDENGGDRFSATVSASSMNNWATVAYPVHEAFLHGCYRNCQLRAPVGWGPDDVAVLRGFAFLRGRTVDDNIHEIYVSLPQNCAEGECVVNTSLRDKSGDDQFSALVQYSIIPRAIVEDTHLRQSTEFDKEAVLRDRRVWWFGGRDRAFAIRGFSFSFIERSRSSNSRRTDRFLGRLQMIINPLFNVLSVMMRDGGDDNSVNPTRYSVAYYELVTGGLHPVAYPEGYPRR